MLIAKTIINRKNMKLSPRALLSKELFSPFHIPFFITERSPEGEFSFFGYFPVFGNESTDA